MRVRASNQPLKKFTTHQSYFDNGENKSLIKAMDILHSIKKISIPNLQFDSSNFNAANIVHFSVRVELIRILLI